MTHAHSFPRNAFTLTEVVVAATLLAATTAVIAPLAFHQRRLWTQTRYQQLAVDELTNQLERLTAGNTDERSTDELESAISELKPSQAILNTFPDAAIEGSVDEHQDGTTVRLTLRWQNPSATTTVRQRAVSLVGWHRVLATDSDTEEVREEEAP